MDFQTFLFCPWSSFNNQSSHVLNQKKNPQQFQIALITSPSAQNLLWLQIKTYVVADRHVCSFSSKRGLKQKETQMNQGLKKKNKNIFVMAHTRRWQLVGILNAEKHVLLITDS